MSETQHTPTPWKVTVHHNRAAVWDGYQIIASCGMQEEAEANAAFICRACNAHDGLVAECRNALASIQIAKIPALDHSVASTTEILSIIQDSLRAALAKLEKEGS